MELLLWIVTGTIAFGLYFVWLYCYRNNQTNERPIRRQTEDRGDVESVGESVPLLKPTTAISARISSPFRNLNRELELEAETENEQAPEASNGDTLPIKNVNQDDVLVASAGNSHTDVESEPKTGDLNHKRNVLQAAADGLVSVPEPKTQNNGDHTERNFADEAAAETLGDSSTESGQIDKIPPKSNEEGVMDYPTPNTNSIPSGETTAGPASSSNPSEAPPIPVMRISNSFTDIQAAFPTEPDDQMKALADAFKAIRGGLGAKNTARRRFDREPEFDTEEISEEGIVRRISGSFVPTLPPDFVMVDVQGVTCTLTKEQLGRSRVVRLVKLRDCNVTVSKNIGALVKLFMEECKDTTVTLECKILTQHVEIVRCERLHVYVRVRTETMQVDLSKDVKILCDKDSCRRIYHAGVQELQVCSEDTETCTVHDYRFPDDPISSKLSEEEQYLTEIDDGEMKTKRVKYELNSLVPVADTAAANAGIGKCET